MSLSSGDAHHAHRVRVTAPRDRPDDPMTGEREHVRRVGGYTRAWGGPALLATLLLGCTHEPPLADAADAAAVVTEAQVTEALASPYGGGLTPTEAACVATKLTHGDLSNDQLREFATKADHPSRMDALIVASFACHEKRGSPATAP